MQRLKQDLREYKNQLRLKYKDIRRNLINNNKNSLDDKILNKITSLKAYKNCNVLLTFVSTDIEVNTRNLIQKAFTDGKIVAVPKCIDGTRNMKFYIINSFDDLEVATFSVLEPKVHVCKELDNFENSICVVPGLAFDLNGYRLGYGKGYYDRFLSGYKGINIGVCYCCCTLPTLICGKYDRSVDYLVTEKYVKSM